MRRVVLPALLAAAACAPRPPEGMVRLDSGGMNHDCAVDAGLRRLYCISGQGVFATELLVAGLDDGRGRRYRFPERSLLALNASGDAGTVTLAAEIVSLDQRFRPKERPSRAVMTVDAETGRVLRERTAASADLAGGGSASPEVEIAGDSSPGVNILLGPRSKRVARFFSTSARPSAVARGPRGEVFVAHSEGDGQWALERLDAGTGARQTLTRFPGEIESLAAWGSGIALLRRGNGGAGPRVLSLVEAGNGWLTDELPWGDDFSEILGVDGERQRLYMVMNERGHQTCWAIPLSRESLRAASAYLAAARAPKPVTRGFVLAVWASALVLLAALTAALQGKVGRR